MKTQNGDDLILIQLRMAVACIALAVLGGMAAVLHYIPQLSPWLAEAGLGLTKLRPLHTTFASVWIFGCAVAVVYHYLARHGDGLDAGDRWRFRFHTICWLGAGVGILVSLLMGVLSGREYIGFHPVFSAVLLLGWLAFAWSFLKRGLRGFWQQPIYIWFWTIGVLYFIYTFTEGHAYLLPWVEQQPIRDLQLQWKSCGTLVGSFNFLVYGSLIYVSERMSGDRSYAQSPLAFSLFGVGCLNSFTNYVHHTYHLPQEHFVKWVAFIVSMMEIIILLRLLYDIRRMVARRVGNAPFNAALGYLTSAKWWTAAMLVIALLISVPNLNSLIHGTKVVVGHAMGTELGIDTMVLFGAVAFLLRDLGQTSRLASERLDRPAMRSHLLVLNIAMAVLVAWLTVSGLVHGVYRFNGEPSPTWVGYERYFFPLFGAVLALSLLYLVVFWTPMLLGRSRADQEAARSST